MTSACARCRACARWCARASFLGVVAEREEQAVRALTALARAARWEEADDLPDENAIHDFLLAQPTEDEILLEKSARARRGG